VAAGIKPTKEVAVPKTTLWGKQAWLPTWLRNSRTVLLLTMACAVCASGAFATGANAAEWKIQATPNPTAASSLVDVSCVSTKECLAVGESKGPFNLRWNGTAWGALTSIGKNPLGEISCVSASFCMAIGFGEEAQRWNGSEWTSVNAAKPPTSVQTELQRVSCVSTTFCIAVGNYEIAGGHDRTLAESWNGTAWTILSTPSEEGGLNLLNSVSCTTSTSCTAIGQKAGIGIALRWNGTEWNALGKPNAASNTSGDISCTAPNACIAELGGSNAKVERWDGTEWTAYTVPTPAGGSTPSLDGISCASAFECFAVGSYTKEAKTLSLAELWNGLAWVVVPTPNLAKGGLFASVSCSSAAPLRCTAVGYYREHVGAVQTLAARYE
jgi:hypothetical protein